MSSLTLPVSDFQVREITEAEKKLLLAYRAADERAQGDALKMLLDKGLSADAAGKMWGHALFDMMILKDSDPYTDDFMYRGWTWLMKVIMLCASYDHVLQNDQDLQELIAVDDNGYDLHAFRNWENFYFEFDTTWCEDYPKIDGCMVMIFEKATGKEIWDFRV